MIEIRTPTDGIPCPMCTRAPTASHLLGTSLPEGGYAVCGRGKRRQQATALQHDRFICALQWPIGTKKDPFPKERISKLFVF